MLIMVILRLYLSLLQSVDDVIMGSVTLDFGLINYTLASAVAFGKFPDKRVIWVVIRN